MSLQVPFFNPVTFQVVSFFFLTTLTVLTTLQKALVLVRHVSAMPCVELEGNVIEARIRSFAATAADCVPLTAVRDGAGTAPPPPEAEPPDPVPPPPLGFPPPPLALSVGPKAANVVA